MQVLQHSSPLQKNSFLDIPKIVEATPEDDLIKKDETPEAESLLYSSNRSHSSSSTYSSCSTCGDYFPFLTSKVNGFIQFFTQKKNTKIRSSLGSNLNKDFNIAIKTSHNKDLSDLENHVDIKLSAKISKLIVRNFGIYRDKAQVQKNNRKWYQGWHFVTHAEKILRDTEYLEQARATRGFKFKIPLCIVMLPVNLILLPFVSFFSKKTLKIKDIFTRIENMSASLVAVAIPALATIAVLNSWNPLGWAIALGFVTCLLASFLYGSYICYKAEKSQDSNNYVC